MLLVSKVSLSTFLTRFLTEVLQYVDRKSLPVLCVQDFLNMRDWHELKASATLIFLSG